MGPEPTTEDLVRRAQGGDRAAAGEIARRYGERVRSMVHGRLAGRIRVRADTEDVLQATMMVAVEDLRDLEWRGEEAFVGWLVQVAERQVLQEARRQRRRQRDVGRERGLSAAGDFPTERTSPTQAAVRGEVMAGIRAAVATLPDAERRAVELHTYQGLSFEAVAKELGLPDRTTAYRLFQRALKAMARALDAGEGGGA